MLIYSLPFILICLLRYDYSIKSYKNLDSDPGLHVIYKREVTQKEFCGLESTITSSELSENENEVSEDVFAVGQRLSEEGKLIVSKYCLFLKRNYSTIIPDILNRLTPII